MFKNLNLLRGLVFSQPLMLALVEKGLTREEAYVIVQEMAMQVWKDETLQFKNLVKKNSKVTEILSDEEIEKIFDVKTYLKNVEAIFERVFKKEV